MFSSIADGLRAAVKQPKLVALLWAWYSLLSLVPGLPALAWLRDGLDLTPAADSALRRFDFGLLGDLLNYNQTNVLALLTTTMLVTGLVALVSSAFVMGGILEVLGGGNDERSFMHRFFRGCGHFFWRFVRLAIVGGVCAGLAVSIVAPVVGAMTMPRGDSEWEPGGYLGGLVTVLAVAATAALFLLALDYARIRVTRDDSRKMLRAYFGSLGFVLRHAVATYGMGLVVVALLASVMLLYVAYETNSPAASTGALLFVLFVFQQFTVIARVFLRVALVGGERSYFNRIKPVAVLANAPAVMQADAVQHTAGEGAADTPASEAVSEAAASASADESSGDVR